MLSSSHPSIRRQVTSRVVTFAFLVEEWWLFAGYSLNTATHYWQINKSFCLCKNLSVGWTNQANGPHWASQWASSSYHQSLLTTRILLFFFCISFYVKFDDRWFLHQNVSTSQRGDRLYSHWNYTSALQHYIVCRMRKIPNYAKI